MKASLRNGSAAQGARSGSEAWKAQANQDSGCRAAASVQTSDSGSSGLVGKSPHIIKLNSGSFSFKNGYI